MLQKWSRLATGVVCSFQSTIPRVTICYAGGGMCSINDRQSLLAVIQRWLLSLTLLDGAGWAIPK